MIAHRALPSEPPLRGSVGSTARQRRPFRPLRFALHLFEIFGDLDQLDVLSPGRRSRIWSPVVPSPSMKTFFSRVRAAGT
jgi:hypothetical protein